ncbi:MAG: hypothetical protein QM758_21360 [Armatimonas sp.]
MPSRPGLKESLVPVVRMAERPGLIFYSEHVNAISAWADAGDDTWLVTLMGIKRVSRNPDIPPRHYTLWDGLPGLWVSAIVADERGVYVLIDIGGKEALCTLDTATDTWKTLTYLEKDSYASFVGEFCSLLVLDGDRILATSGTATTYSDSVLLCFDRETNESITIPWDRAIQAEQDSLTIGFLACQNNTISLGTSIGWFELPLSPEGGPWVRRLADTHIHRGVAGGGGLYLWMSQRRPRNDSGYYQRDIHRVDPQTWQTTPLPHFFPPPADTVPCAVDAQGHLWLPTHVNGGMGGPYLTPGQVALRRWSQAESRWVELTDEGDAPESSTQNLNMTLISQLPSLAPESVIPDGPARLLTLAPYRQRMAPRSLRWLLGRFPHWLSPDATEELPFLIGQGTHFYNPAVVEPGAPEHAWLGIPGALICIPTSALPFPPVPAGGMNRLVTGKWNPCYPAQDIMGLPEDTLVGKHWQGGVKASSLTPQVLATDTSALWGALAAQHGHSAALFRFEPATRQFTLFDERSGLSEVTSPRIVMNQQEPWVLCGQGAYRFDTDTQCFVQELTVSAVSIALSDSGAEVWLVGQSSSGETCLYRWKRGLPGVVPITDPAWSQCFDVVCTDEATVIATDQGLYQLEAQGSWIAIDSAGMPPRKLQRGEGNSLWAFMISNILHIQLGK